jgi:hypothetical protein
MAWAEEMNEEIFEICSEIGLRENEFRQTPVDHLSAGIFSYLRSRNNFNYLTEVFDKNQGILRKKRSKKRFESNLNEYDLLVQKLSLDKDLALEFYINSFRECGIKFLETRGFEIFSKSRRKKHLSSYLIHIPSKIENINFGVHFGDYYTLWGEIRDLNEGFLTNKKGNLLIFDDFEFKNSCIKGNYCDLDQPIVSLSRNNFYGALFNLKEFRKIGLELIRRKGVIPFDTSGNLIDQNYKFPHLSK